MKKTSLSRYIFLTVIVLGIMFIYGLRLLDWQVVKGAEFLDLSNKTNAYVVPVEAARGQIFDVNGNPLAINATGYSVVFDKIYLKSGTENTTVLALQNLFAQRSEKWVDELPISLTANGYEFIAGKETDVAALKKNLRLQSYATAQNCMDALVNQYSIKGYTPEQTRNIASVRYNMEQSGFSISTPYVFSESISQDTVSVVSELSQSLPGVSVKMAAVRQYVNGTLAPQIVGTIGAISQDEYKAKKDSGYTYTDKIGKEGIEKYAEDQLRGKRGEKVINSTKDGSLISDTTTVFPTPGNSVFLTIDSRIQDVANKSLAKYIAEAQETKDEKLGGNCKSGAVVVLNVKDFSVLAASTYPSYDLTQYAADPAYKLAQLTDETNKPLINRAFNGTYSPGSTYKLVSALGGLQEGKITANTTFTCNHVFTPFASKDYAYYCMGWHGVTDLREAITESCNIYFYNVGLQLGINSIDLYAKHFGLGQKTGIEVGESSGILAGPDYRKANGLTQWMDGDTLHAVIGQAENSFTPVQLATYVATIANNGVRLQTHLVSKVTDYNRQNVLSQTAPVVKDNIGVSEQNLKTVQSAMRNVVVSGTASTVLGGYSIPVAAKTGTAEGAGNDNSIFICYAPYDNPQIAIAVVLEHGVKGKFTQGVAKDIMDAYFYPQGVPAA